MACWHRCLFRLLCHHGVAFVGANCDACTQVPLDEGIRNFCSSVESETWGIHKSHSVVHLITSTAASLWLRRT
eukprot:scaffold2999_cov113-Cylindrotheca_fusiformis.AAC.6